MAFLIPSRQARRPLRRLALLALLAALLAPALGAAARTGEPEHVFLPMVWKNYRPVAPGLPIDPYATHRGEGTYYAATGAGNCSFPAQSGSPLLVAAMNNPDYNSALYCGAFVEATGPLGSVIVQIVDRCPECAAGDLDFSVAAFDRIARRQDGRVPISWRVVSPALSGPIRYHFKEGSHQWWMGVQIRNHRNPVFKFEYRNSAGSFVAVPRQSYNYFVIENAGVGPFTFRVTDFYGNVLTDSGIPLLADNSAPGAAQFPPQQ